MARIGFLFLIVLCIYLAFDRPVFAQPIDVVLQDTVKKKNKKDTLQLDTAQIIRKNLSAKDILDQKKKNIDLSIFGAIPRIWSHCHIKEGSRLTLTNFITNLAEKAGMQESSSASSKKSINRI